MARVLLNPDDRIEVHDTDLGLPDGDPDTVYILRPLTTEAHRDIVKQFTTYVLNKGTHQREPKRDDDAIVDAMYDYVLVDWRGIVDSAHQPVPCTPAAKRGLGTVIRAALLERAGLNQIESVEVAEASSFRGPREVRDVVAG